MNKRSCFLLGSILTCSLLAACGSNPKTVGNQIQENESSVQSTEEAGLKIETSTESKDPKAAEPSHTAGNRIEEQSFDVSLRPLGRVTFASYEPDTSRTPLADVDFSIERDGKVIQKLAGVFEGNQRSNEVFNQVEAVAFLDYNNDGYDDIIVICSYLPASGPDAGTDHSEIRYYSGSEGGTFTYQKQMSMDASSALDVITIQTAKGYLGLAEGEPASMESWKLAYLDYLHRDSDVANQEGYLLIYVDDDEIPELVEIGKSEAGGCRIVNYSKGTIYVTQLDRLYFSYIERGNLLCNSGGLMDSYYDLVYRIIDGKMTLVSEGYYGAEDNANVQFDEAGNPIYQYEWNGVKMSKEEYDTQLNSVYDAARAKDGYSWGEWNSLDEITALLEKSA